MMMSAKYKIRVSELTGVTDTMINIPINLTPQMVDQAELVEKKFVDVEVENAINPISDYEKARFSPINIPNLSVPTVYNEIESITYNVKFINSSGFPSSQSMYGDIGITDDDIKYSKKRFENSHLTLSFYSSDRATDQRLISYINLYPKITTNDIQGVDDPTPGLPKSASLIPITFQLTNPIKNPAGFAEGFYIYNFKDEVTSELPKELYMRARFNNSANGESTNMITEGQAFYINDLVNKLYVRYILYRNNTGYYYMVDEDYSTNVIRTGNNIVVNMYQIQAL